VKLPTGRSVLGGLLRKKRSEEEEEEHRHEKESPQGSDAQASNPRTRAGCQSYQPAQRIHQKLPQPVASNEDDDDGNLARTARDASTPPLSLCRLAGTPETPDDSVASCESVDGSADAPRSDALRRMNRIYGGSSTSSVSSVASFHSSSSRLFLPLASSRASLLRASSLSSSSSEEEYSRASSQASIYGLRGGGSSGHGTLSEWGKNGSFGVDADAWRDSFASGECVLDPVLDLRLIRGSVKGEEGGEEGEEEYEIDEYYYGAYSAEERGEYDEGMVDSRASFEDPHICHTQSSGELLGHLRESVLADRSRRSGRILEGQYDMDHDEQIMSPRESTQEEPRWFVKEVQKSLVQSITTLAQKI
jgi:hypothetical protein